MSSLSNMIAYTTMRWALLAAIAATASAAGPGGAPEGPTEADFENVHFSRIIAWTWIACAGSLIIYQIIIHSVRYVRTITCLNNDSQRFFARPNLSYSTLKRDFIYAPLLRTRHHREFKLSAALNVGTLPSRMQTLYLAGYLAMNVAFCVLSIDWSGVEKSVASELRNRTGVLAVMNMLPLFLMAGRNNPLIKWCGISFDTFNLIHRWIGRIVVLEALAHTCAWMVSKVHQGQSFSKLPLLTLSLC